MLQANVRRLYSRMHIPLAHLERTPPPKGCTPRPQQGILNQLRVPYSQNKEGLTREARMLRGEPRVLATPDAPGLSRSATVRARPREPRGDVSSRSGMLSVRSRPRCAAAHTNP